jgi:acetyl esterase/lipase
MSEHTITETEVLFAGGDGSGLAAILYRPDGPVAAAVVDVHGGAWTAGSRHSDAVVARYLAERGIAVLSIDFRMPPAACYPATVSDVSAAIGWLKAHAAQAGTVAERVGVLGLSSGGHLALLATLRPFDPRYAGAASPDVPAAAVPFVAVGWAVTDPLARYRMACARPEARLIAAHHAFWPDEAAMEDGSPIGIVTRGDAQRYPELLIVQGTEDENLTPDMQSRFTAAYRARGGSVELVEYPGETHAFVGKDPTSAASRDALARIATFLHAQASATGRTAERVVEP